ncbi:MAG: response regulator transcription factor [Bryobacteraceae bacterium]
MARLCDNTGRFQVVDQSADGHAALQAVQALRPDIALIDFQIPKLFSLELVRRSRELALPTRFVILAARGDRKSALESLRSGANGFILKSSPGSQMLDGVSQVAGGSIYVSPELEFEKIFMSNRGRDVVDPLESLSSREFQVFRLLIDGIRAKEIAARLTLSPKTIDTYRASLMRKLDIHDVASLVKFAILRELVTP